MFFIRYLALIISITLLTIISEAKEGGNVMTASGFFEVNLEQQLDESAPVGRMIINKKYTGDIEGTGIGQMISKRVDGGAAVYSAIEEFVGTVRGKSGSFTLVHIGHMSKEIQSLDVNILEGSGKDGLKDIAGEMEIIQEGGEHKYVLTYELRSAEKGMVHE